MREVFVVITICIDTDLMTSANIWILLWYMILSLLLRLCSEWWMKKGGAASWIHVPAISGWNRAVHNLVVLFPQTHYSCCREKTYSLPPSKAFCASKMSVMCPSCWNGEDSYISHPACVMGLMDEWVSALINTVWSGLFMDEMTFNPLCTGLTNELMNLCWEDDKTRGLMVRLSSRQVNVELSSILVWKSAEELSSGSSLTGWEQWRHPVIQCFSILLCSCRKKRADVFLSKRSVIS